MVVVHTLNGLHESEQVTLEGLVSEEVAGIRGDPDPPPQGEVVHAVEDFFQHCQAALEHLGQQFQVVMQRGVHDSLQALDRAEVHREEGGEKASSLVAQAVLEKKQRLRMGLGPRQLALQTQRITVVRTRRSKL